MFVPNPLDQHPGITIADLVQSCVDLGDTRGIKSIGMQIQRTGLIRCLKDIGDIHKQHVEEEVGEQGAYDAAFRVEAFPALVAVMGEPH